MEELVAAKKYTKLDDVELLGSIYRPIPDQNICMHLLIARDAVIGLVIDMDNEFFRAWLNVLCQASQVDEANDAS